MSVLLNITKEYILKILKLEVLIPEDKCILKEFLENKLEEQNIKGIEFTDLKGNYQDYWFLDSSRIKNMKLDDE